ncbi:hypothetical protein DYB25_008989 [Aphanomyces astaci]|uniref:Uncharacterized protein n=1 Tax=Aphanomyces astaci TaxID=112090 RepID=A0A397DVZ8_APHAT|nr:hypothetical protein DYB36_013370 [Aphanomyces astaci]RHY08827.1 hypothetical protein DYB25_008989 [Aphanomyces astaci]RHY39407.1 hypothetical protein DYB34_014246 [Aphanomyces astaci]RHY69214.1 hypothetical protein DYB30_010877 [Aphanomyces astaci]RHY72469.1 hypothetical protein DYB38_012763 [Aphanomyces astaci]
MIKCKLRGDPKELDEAVLEPELRKIVVEPKNGVEVDIPLLFHGIHMDMKDDDVLSANNERMITVDKNNATCANGVTTANGAAVKGATDAIDQANGPNHETITQATALNLATDTVVVRTNGTMKNAVPFNWSRENSDEKPKAVDSNQAYPLMFGEIDMHDYDEDGNLHMQNGKMLKPKAKKLRDSLMTVNKKWREEQEQCRVAKTTEPEKKKLQRMLENPAGESVATINNVLDMPYSAGRKNAA